MLTSMLIALLAADEPTPTPPPLVPLEQAERAPLVVPPMPPPQPLDAQPARAEAEAEAHLEEGWDGAHFNPGRVIAVGAVAAATGALLVGSAFAFMVNTRDPSAPFFLLFSLPASLFVGSGIAFGVHRAMGGAGGYGAHLAGAAIGGALALLLAGGVMAAESGSPRPAASVGGIFGMSALFGIGTALMGELSNHRTLNENGVTLMVVPTRDGAMASAGFRI